MNPTLSGRRLVRGFSLLEMLLVLSLIGILGAIGITTVGSFRPAVEKSKLQSDVAHLNAAVKVYLHSGGSLDSATGADAVISRLKTHREESTSQTFVGFTGSMIDRRIGTIHVDSSYRGARVVYRPETKRFEVTSDPVAGVLLELEGAETSRVAESRDPSVVEYASTSDWVWDYEDASPAPRVNPTLIAKTRILPQPPANPNPAADPPPAPTPILQKLLPPIFSPTSDYFDLAQFPFPITLENPNGPDSGRIIYGVVNADDWEWREYSGPISVRPGDKVLAFVESLKPQDFHHSDPADETYEWVTSLRAPAVVAAPDQIDARTGSTRIEITHDNNPGGFVFGDRVLPYSSSAFEVEYRLVPLVPGEGSPTGWASYREPFEVGGPQFPRGFDVVARVVSRSPHFTDSAEAEGQVTAFYELDPPGIESTLDVITRVEDSTTITLSNPNPSGSSRIEYRLFDAGGSPATGWLTYGAPFEVFGSEFPDGFTVSGRAEPLDPYYRSSDTADLPVQVTFFELAITGQTIFVLDSSGSMSTKGRIDRLKEATRTALAAFEAGNRFAIIDYDTSPQVLIPWGYGTDERKTRAIAAIEAMAAGGSTNYHAALQAAIDLNAGEATQVVFLSDGRPNNRTLPDPFTTDGILELVDQLTENGARRLDTVALGTIQPILAEMAERGNGSAVSVADE